MSLIELSIVIIVVVGCVRFVHIFAYKAGIKSGIDKGRFEILEENLIREQYKK